ncbi:MAG: hypothetical protein KC877_03390 [Candidatus Kaiserbacteria bacterium]|nr:hypothetical protein [Candidatus Kaiserbacteria bacterium]MCB9815877.1 hypothetical protein [Candidatus Nomurabacteria bacterium]
MIDCTKQFNSVLKLVLFSVVLFFVSVTAASAEVVVRSDYTVSVTEDQVIAGDFYTAANILNVSGVIESDLVAATGKTTINGSVNGDAFIATWSQTDVHGTIGDDLRIISTGATIAEPVMGDLLVIGSSVHILSTASIAGDVVIYAGQVNIEGSVGGDVLGTMKNLRINGPVAGDVDVKVDEFALGDRAAIEGSVRYVSSDVLNLSPDHRVGGEIFRNDPVIDKNEYQFKSLFVSALVVLFTVLVWFLISRRSLEEVVKEAATKSVRSLVVGLLVLLLAPLATIILLFSVIGMFVGIVFLFLYALLVTLSFAGLSAVIGHVLMRVFNQPSARLSLVTLVVGVFAVILLVMLPVVGQVALFLCMLVTLGAIVDLLLRARG